MLEQHSLQVINDVIPLPYILHPAICFIFDPIMSTACPPRIPFVSPISLTVQREPVSPVCQFAGYQCPYSNAQPRASRAF